MAKSNCVNSLPLHLSPCHNDQPSQSPSDGIKNGSIGGMGVNARVMTSLECTSFISDPHVSQMSGVRENLLPFPFLLLLFYLRWPGVNSPGRLPCPLPPCFLVWFEMVWMGIRSYKNQVSLDFHPPYPEVCNHFVIWENKFGGSVLFSFIWWWLSTLTPFIV